ncbi:leucine-rich repeat domain-containing protein, partial [Formosa sp. S-31]|uniref:leucine-rich repeat domain-containing protein n=1 Tax=Formosa sp. S-31 TaxID=2790949 RepID=UPI003EB97CC5
MKKNNVLLKFLFIIWCTPFFAQAPVPSIEYQTLVDFYNATEGDNWTNKWNISSNNLHSSDWYGIVIENGHIVEIALRSNRIAGPIPASFSNLKQLRKLDLYGNDLITTDLENISGLESLEELDLGNCKLAGTIPNSWGQLTKLKSLVLYYNTFEGAIFNEIGNLTALETINLSYNSFTSIPSAIGKLSSLKTLR